MFRPYGSHKIVILKQYPMGEVCCSYTYNNMIGCDRALVLSNTLEELVNTPLLDYFLGYVRVSYGDDGAHVHYNGGVYITIRRIRDGRNWTTFVRDTANDVGTVTSTVYRVPKRWVDVLKLTHDEVTLFKRDVRWIMFALHQFGCVHDIVCVIARYRCRLFHAFEYSRYCSDVRYESHVTYS